MDTAQLQTTETLKEKAAQVLPAGVSAAGRFNPSIGHTLYVERANSARLYDVDGRAYIDYTGSPWTPR